MHSYADLSLEKFELIRPVLEAVFPKEKEEYNCVDVLIEFLGRTYHYYMTNSLELLNRKIEQDNFIVPKLTDFRQNPYLSKEVIKKMASLHMCFSMELEVAHVVNFCLPNALPRLYQLEYK